MTSAAGVAAYLVLCVGVGAWMGWRGYALERDDQRRLRAGRPTPPRNGGPE